MKHKYVLLLITELEIPPEEQKFFRWIHQQSMRYEFNIVWLPIVDPKIPMNEEIFRGLQQSFPWFSAEHPSGIDPMAIKFIHEDLNFKSFPLVAVLDPKGVLVNHNALPMLYIWGVDAFPFTLQTENQLWHQSGWNMHLLADHVDQRLPGWVYLFNCQHFHFDLNF